jgi:hypothetical protein
MEKAQAGKRRIIRWYDGGGSLCWVTLLVVVLVMVAIDPDARSVVGNYRDGSQRFLDGAPLYDLEVAMGYLYSPAFAVLYAPFYALGPHLGDVLWRLVGFAVLSWAAIRQALLIDDERPVWLISCGFFLATPLCAGSVRNGQATILLAGACWLLILAVLQRRWLQTLLWATLAIVAKSTAIVALLLAGALRPRFIPLLVLALVILLALPYAFAPADYVTGANRSFLMLMDEMSLDRNANFQPADFTAPFTALGIDIPTTVASAVRVIAALITLAAVLWFARCGEKGTAGLVIFVLASYYMSVFNPRVEGNTYALLAVPFGLSISLMYRREGMTPLSLVLGALLFFSGFSGVEPHIHGVINLLFQPVVSTALFAGIS